MATNLTAAQAKFNWLFYRNFMGWSGEMLKLTSFVVDPQPQVAFTDVYGFGAWTAQNGLNAVTNREVRAQSVLSQPAVWEHKVELTNKEVRDTPGILENAAMNAASRFLEDLSDVFFGKFSAADATAHPENGVSGSPYAATGGGTVYMADSFDMTFVNGGTKTQANLYNLQLGDTALGTVIQARVDYRERGGERASMPGEKPFLVTGPSKMILGQDLSEQTGRIFDGAGLQSGWANRIAGHITAPSFPTNAWSLVWRRQFSTYGQDGQVVTFNRCPVWVHLRKLPVFRVTEVDRNTTIVLGEAEYAVGYFPFEGDFILSKP